MKKLILLAAVVSLTVSAFSQKRIAQVKTREDFLNEEYCSGFFKTVDADYFDFLDDGISNSAMGYFNVLDWLQGRVAGLQIYRTRFNQSIPVIRGQVAAVFIDEIRVDYGFLTALPVTDIAMIKVIKGPFYGSWGGGGGAIAVYTRRGMDT